MPAWWDCTVATNLSRYRRRLGLPFAAVYALVFINSATLAPFCPLSTDSRAALGSPPSTFVAGENWRWLQYERGHGEPSEQTAIAAVPPPIVKNLRRSSLRMQSGCCSQRILERLDDTPGLNAAFIQRALAANAADLSRLCRRLL